MTRRYLGNMGTLESLTISDPDIQFIKARSSHAIHFRVQRKERCRNINFPSHLDLALLLEQFLRGCRLFVI